MGLHNIIHKSNILDLENINSDLARGPLTLARGEGGGGNAVSPSDVTYNRPGYVDAARELVVTVLNLT